MNPTQVALYARVSTDQQTEAQTVASQVAALRQRGGKRHAARSGVVNVLSGAPYGYRYVAKYAGGGQARYELVPDEARLVRQVFDWVGRDRLTIGEVCRRLTRAGEVTRTGKTVWDRSVVWGM